MADPMTDERLEQIRDAAVTLRREGNPDVAREELLDEIDRLRAALEPDLDAAAKAAQQERMQAFMMAAMTAERDRMRAVYDAAVAWRRADIDPETKPGGRLLDDLADAVDATMEKETDDGK